MLSKAIYPGSFDPVTNGHLDIMLRSLKLVDHLVIAVGNNKSKEALFSVEEKMQMLADCLKQDYIGKQIVGRYSIVSYNGLLVEFIKANDINVIIRGIRALSDFDFEFNLAGMNAKIYPQAETIFLTSSEHNQFISSMFVKEIAMYGGDVSSFVPPIVKDCLIKKLNIINT
jgi:pantetheine-phosphate adenylyltransferase